MPDSSTEREGWCCSTCGSELIVKMYITIRRPRWEFHGFCPKCDGYDPLGDVITPDDKPEP